MFTLVHGRKRNQDPWFPSVLVYFPVPVRVKCKQAIKGLTLSKKFLGFQIVSVSSGRNVQTQLAPGYNNSS